MKHRISFEREFAQPNNPDIYFRGRAVSRGLGIFLWKDGKMEDRLQKQKTDRSSGKGSREKFSRPLGPVNPAGQNGGWSAVLFDDALEDQRTTPSLCNPFPWKLYRLPESTLLEQALLIQ